MMKNATTMARSRSSLSQSISDHLRQPSYDLQMGRSWGVRDAPAMLPIPECRKGNPECIREFALRHAQLQADSSHVRHADDTDAGASFAATCEFDRFRQAFD